MPDLVQILWNHFEWQEERLSFLRHYILYSKQFSSTIQTNNKGQLLFTLSKLECVKTFMKFVYIFVHFLMLNLYISYHIFLCPKDIETYFKSLFKIAVLNFKQMIRV